MKFSGYLLATDLDGTFTVDNGHVSLENRIAIERYQRMGGLFTVSSGRSIEYIRSLTGFRPNAPIIAFNGAAVYDPDSMMLLKDWPLDPELLKEADRMAETGLCEHIILNGPDLSASWKKDRDAGMKPSEFFAPYADRKLYKLVFAQNREYTLALHELMQAQSHRYYSCMSWSMGIEILQKGSGKGPALQWIRDHSCGITCTIGVGDYENDISLIRDADIGYAVGNADPEVKAAADRITVRHTESAIAHILYDIERDIDSGKQRI